MLEHLIGYEIHMLLYLLSLFLTTYGGVWLARKINLNAFVGGLVGFVFHVPGLAVLAVVWGVKSLDSYSPPPVKPA